VLDVAHIFHLVFVFILAHIHLIHGVIVDLLVYSHASLVLLSGFVLHLDLASMLHVIEPLHHFLLRHPLLVVLRGVLCHLMHVLLNSVVNLRVATELGHLVGFVKFLGGQPSLHVASTRVMEFFLLLGVLEELLSHLALVLIDQFLFETFLCVLLAHPLLEVRGVFVGVNTSTRGFGTLRLQQGEFGASADWSLV